MEFSGPKTLETPMNADATPMNADESVIGNRACRRFRSSNRPEDNSSVCLYRRSSAFIGVA
jgi:hypothetical protein